MSQSKKTLKGTFELLADFFECKGDQILTQNEVAVCLEWLQQVTQPVLFSTPATVRKSARLAAASTTPMRHSQERRSEMTPVKRQIRELLETAKATPFKTDTFSKATPISEETAVENIPSQTPISASVPAALTHGPVVVTRTAKTILDVLSSGASSSTKAHATPERTKPVVTLPSPSSQVTLAMSIDIDAQQEPKSLHHHPSIGDSTVTLFGPEHYGEGTATTSDLGYSQPMTIEPITISPSLQPSVKSSSMDTSESLRLASGANLPTFSFDTGSIGNDEATQQGHSIPEGQLPHFHFDV